MKNENTRMRFVCNRWAASIAARRRESSASKSPSTSALPTGEAIADTLMSAARRRSAARSSLSGPRSTTLSPHAERSSRPATPFFWRTVICSYNPGAISSPNAPIGQRSATWTLAGRASVGYTQHQGRLKYQLLALGVTLVRRHEQSSGDLTQLTGRLLDHGQGRRHQRRPGGVAKPDHGDVLRPAHSASAERPEHASGQNHAAAEDGVRPRRQREHVERALPPVLKGEGTQAYVFLVVCKARLFESRPITSETFARSGNAGQSVHERDATMTGFDEQPTRLEGAAVVVHHDPVEMAVAAIAIHQDDRYAAGPQALSLGWDVTCRRQDQTVDPGPGQRRQGLQRTRWLVAARGRDQHVPWLR